MVLMESAGWSNILRNLPQMTSERKKPTGRDPTSHRLIEKRRRDRMNSCLADLARLVPNHYKNQLQGRVEKTEIVEMAIRHMKTLTQEGADERRRGYDDALQDVARILVEDGHEPLARHVLDRLQAPSQLRALLEPRVHFKKDLLRRAETPPRAAFVLHPSGHFYVPAHVEARAVHFDEEEAPTQLHPVSIAVQFK